MVIRYTSEEWEKLPLLKKSLRLELAPEGVAEKIELLFEEAWVDLQDSSVQANLCEYKNQEEKALRILEYYQKAESHPDFYSFIEQQGLTAVGIAYLAKLAFFGPEMMREQYTEERRQGGKLKNSGWLPVVIELWLKHGEDFKTKEQFCYAIADGWDKTPLGNSMVVPKISLKAETIRKALNHRAIDNYQDRLDVERRKNGIS
ncbi:hypothetical protein QEZ63_16035 [Alcaligenes faecalis]|nr:hypothetical protein QEZ63_16035 [Alcaligenes faecalis]